MLSELASNPLLRASWNAIEDMNPANFSIAVGETLLALELTEPSPPPVDV